MSAFLHCASQSGPSSSKYLENFEELNFDCRIVCCLRVFFKPEMAEVRSIFLFVHF